MSEGVTRVLAGRVGVDSGQLVVGDPCYFSGDNGWTTDVGEFEPSDEGQPFTYTGACNVTLSAASCGELGEGMAVATRTTFGDGVYPVYVELDPAGRPVRLVVELDGEAEDEDADDEDDAGECMGCHEVVPADELTLVAGDPYCGECVDEAEGDLGRRAEQQGELGELEFWSGRESIPGSYRA
jgi:hypothetical protein